MLAATRALTELRQATWALRSCGAGVYAGLTRPGTRPEGTLLFVDCRRGVGRYNGEDSRAGVLRARRGGACSVQRVIRQTALACSRLRCDV